MRPGHSAQLPTVPVPMVAPQFAFLQKYRLVYFNRNILKRTDSGGTNLRVLAVTGSGELGSFHVDGARKATIRIPTDVVDISYNHRFVVIEVQHGTELEDDDDCTYTLDFDSSSANIRSAEPQTVAIRRLLNILAYFVPKTVSIHKIGMAPGASTASGAKASSAGGDEVISVERVNDDLQPGGGAASGAGAPGEDAGKKKSTLSFASFSLGKMGRAGFNRLKGAFNNFSWRGDAKNSDAAAGVASDDEGAGRESGDTTVTTDVHEKQRKKMNRWHEEILGRMGERDGLDAKEQVLDQLTRLEGQRRTLPALLEAPPPMSPDEELKQQRALAALVMFICRRRAMLNEARTDIVPALRPTTVRRAPHVPASIPVIPSYLDAWRYITVDM